MEIKTLHTIDTEYSADSVEWCPHPDYFQYFVCGTYQLEETNSNPTSITSAPCRRKGRLILYKYNVDDNNLQEIQKVETSAILDIKWLKTSRKPIMAIATALGKIDIYELQNEKLIYKSSISLDSDNPNLLALSLDWIDAESDVYQNEIPSVIASDSKGEISLMKYRPDNKLEIINKWVAHNFEAWICASDKFMPNLIYTGGDDTIMYAFDIRAPSDVMKIYSNKEHMAGVTTLLSHPDKENILLTGSYDERLRIFDTKFLKHSLAELNLKGGIWRIKSDSKESNILLCACMYHNFSILKMDLQNSDVQVVGEYNEHESICYGADWYKNQHTGNDKLVMATCSFYDHKLCLSEVTL